ncbi:MAG: CZB domain-containing protein [Candidatus Omnitrophica bacterium]|nr:CZB domain-containing protein [Candidatus Omnitrophota bacterium]
MSSANFAMIKSQHRAWEKKLGAYLNGQSTLTEIEAFSHEDCDLGKWLYSEGMIKYGTIPQMQELEEVHVELHAMVRRIVKVKQTGRPIPPKDIEKIELINRKIINLLMEVELKIK